MLVLRTKATGKKSTANELLRYVNAFFKLTGGYFINRLSG